jgi:hypothetical protein
MKLHTLLFTICFILISAIAHSQDKGYYSIGNNAQKLKIRGDGKPADSFLRANKGYYDIEPNRRKLRRYIREEQLWRIPEIKKGYFSIGTNVEQLKK